VLGFRAADGARVEPVLADGAASRDAEAAGEDARRPVREGILAWVDAHAARGDALLDPDGARRAAQRALCRLAFFPSIDELAVTRRLCHTESFADGWSAGLVADPARHPIWRPRAWLAGLQSPWRAGFVRASGGIPLAAGFAAAEQVLLALPPAAVRALRALALRAAGLGAR
jgi:hypothetical protein